VSITLRSYQQDLIDRTRAALIAGAKSVLIQAPTGAGKTALTAAMLGAARAKGKRAWFIVHRRELVKQSVEAFRMAGVPCGIVAAGFKMDARQQIQICSIQTLARRTHLLMPPDMIVPDEAHHSVSKSWATVLDQYPKARRIGLTATPERLDGRGLCDHFDEMIQGPAVRSLIDAGYLSDYRYYAPTMPDLEGVGTVAGDLNKGQLSAAMDTPTITGDAVDHYRRLAQGKRAVAFAVSREHSRHIVGQFLGAGVPAEHVDGETKTEDRDAAIERFRTGKTLVLSNVDLFGEGFDLPAIEAAILLRPTASLGLFLQQVGRALRPSPGKSHAIILDHAGNVTRHGLPDDPREWSLDSKPRSKCKAKPSLSVRLCPKCYGAMPPGRMSCAICGHTFAPTPRQVDEVEGELQEMSEADIQRMRREKKREQGRAQTVEQLTKVGRDRGYKNPRRWAENVMSGRMRRRGQAA